MIAEKLRKSILQAAIQGKLTEQLPKDGDARELLEEIKAEKTRLTKEGKIKKETPLPEITEDEIPFDIPDNWCWVRLGEIFNISTGMTPLKSERKYYANGNTPWITSTLTGNEYIYQAEFFITDCALKETRLKVFPVGTLILAMYGQGKTRGQISELGVPCTINQACAALEEIYPNIILRKYVKIFHLYNYNFIRNLSEGTAQPNLNLTKVKETILPLPPIAEQQRIVVAIERALEKIKALEKDELKLDLLQKSFPKKMKDSLLQAAIQGKLTEQLEADGDARTLMADIQKEKERLIKEGKIKKEKVLPEITADEIPFDIPDNWCWARLGTIMYNHGQKRPDREFTYIDISSIDNKANTLGSLTNVLKPNEAPSRARKIVFEGDVIYATVRPYLHNICIIDRKIEPEPIVSTGFAVVCTPMPILNKYLFRYVLSPAFDNYANDNENSKGVAYPAINEDKFLKGLVPLPPLAEQHRIVERLEQLLPLCDALE